MNNTIRKKSFRVIWIMMYAALILGLFGDFNNAPFPIRLLYSCGLWICLFTFPFKQIKYNDFDCLSKIMLKAIVYLTFIAVVNSAFFDNDFHVGNKWITMFCNPDCLFIMLTPCFAFIGSEENSVLILKQSLQVFLLIGIFGIILDKYLLVGILYFSPVFFPYVNKKYKFLILSSLVMAVYISFFAKETSRTAILSIFFAIMSYILSYYIKNRKITSIFCYVMIGLPFVYTIPMLFDPDYSIFEIVQDQIIQNTDIGNSSYDTNDTRSFLFRELSEDLTHNNAWFLGKGVYGHYFSKYFFDIANGDHFDRIGVEVTLLQLLLRGGVCFAIAYYSLIFYAVHNVIRKSKNKFLFSFAVLASGWFFVSTISFFNGCNYRHLGFFLLVGCCLSKNMLEKTDEDIDNILQK